MKKYFFSILLLGCIGSSCTKQENWLDEKININSLVPTRLSDFGALLNADIFFQSYGTFGLIGTDHIYVNDADYFSIIVPRERNAYIWAKDVLEGSNTDEWSSMYRMIEVANVCLEGLERIEMTSANEVEWKRVKGTALFFRGLAYYQLLQFFAPPYDASKAATDLGVPIRLTSDVNIRPGRSTVKDCYDRVLSDLTNALDLLPKVAAFKSRPSEISTYAMLAKVYLTLENWTKAAEFSGLVLAQSPTLIDFNSLNANAAIPFPTFQIGHPEVIQYAEGTLSNFYVGNIPLFDSVLYRSYAGNDLRRTHFFRLFNQRPIFRGFYTGVNMVPFAGIAINEVYLIRAESLARLGQKDAAMQVLNALLVKRWRTGTYVPLVAVDAEDALKKILVERRKEVPFHANLVWEDLRRLNKDSRFARTLTRVIAGVTYTLAPNDKRYTLPIPDLEIQLTGIPQNER